MWDQLFDGHTRVLLERDYLRPWLAHQRWYSSTATGCGSEQIRVEDSIVLRRGPDPHFLVTLHVKCDDGSEQRYAVPLALAGSELADAIAKDTPQRVRRQHHRRAARRVVRSADRRERAPAARR